MYYLSPHSENEEHHPVEEKYRPEHRYIKCTEERHNKSNAKCLRDRVPELEFREAANEGSKLIGSAGGKGGAVGGEVVDLRVDLRREKSDEEVENVDPQAIRHDVEALDQVHADDVDQGHAQARQPPVQHVRRRTVEHVLITARDAVAPIGDGGERRSLERIVRGGCGETHARRSSVHCRICCFFGGLFSSVSISLSISLSDRVFMSL